MPTARYWRIIGIETGAGGDLEVSDIALYADGVRVDALATFSSTAAPIAPGKWAAADVQKPGFALVWDFGSAQTVTEVGLTPIGDGTGSVRVALMQCAAEMHQAWVDVFGMCVIDDGPVIVRSDRYGGTTRFIGGFYADDKDASQYECQVALSNGAALSTVRPLFGSQSLEIVGALANATVALTEPVLFFSDYCIELFVNQANGINFSNNLVQLLDSASGHYIGVRFEYDVGTTYLQVSQRDRGPSYNTGLAKMPKDAWVHIALSSVSGYLSLFLNGAFCFSAPSVQDMRGAAFDSIVLHPAYLRGNYTNSNVNSTQYPLYLTDVVLTKGRRYASNFSVPTAPTYRRFGMSGDVSIVETPAKIPVSIGLFDPQPLAISTAQPARISPDDGIGWVQGTVKRKGEPRDVPLRRRVRLHDKRDMRLIRETWSDAETGVFRFDNIDPSVPFIAITYDHTGRYCALGDDSIRLDG